MRLHVLFPVFMATGLACSGANLAKAPFLTGSTFVEESTKSSGDARAADEKVLESSPTPMPMPAETKTPEESVSPPANISGTYLICSEMKAATMASPESVVNCALREQVTNNKVNIESGYASKLWSYQSMTNTENIVVSMVELPQSLEWHISVTLKAPSFEELQSMQGAVRFYVSVTNNAGIKYQEWASISSTFIRWMPLNGGTIPANAAIGGTEDEGRTILYLCRMYHNGEVILGKLQRHFRDANKSQCWATYNNDKLQSQSEDGLTSLRNTDALVITQGVFDDYFEWVPSTNGLKPERAIITGKDALGNPLYTCRNLQVDANVPEQTPGVLRPGASSCHHEFYGFKTNTSYQVLAWKATATQRILDTRKVAAP